MAEASLTQTERLSTVPHNSHQLAFTMKFAAKLSTQLIYRLVLVKNVNLNSVQPKNILICKKAAVLVGWKVLVRAYLENLIAAVFV